MTAGRLLLWRHGQTSWNATGRFQGQADIELDETGLRQAAEAAPVLAREGVTRLYCSDLLRTRQTAAALTEVTGLEPTLDKRFREISVGDWEGWTLNDVLAADPGYLERERAGEDVRRSPTGESLGEVATRFSEALHEVAEDAEETDTVLVTTHGLAARVGTAAFLGLDLVAARRFGGLRNCHWILLVHKHDDWRIDGWNLGVSAEHLEGLVG
ncbi:histidine phosphatase family protein [Desertihabitans brevis]|uniref:Histidine phosphatase family protein n=1 Tax=Desertihabitans brevis TaxID=2268447 RepID=A0A367YRB5_9ACTN|nr:histidine phosphatase family protein [Desertihabitans brevis]RCK68089.1 histidine phosphatase family protein [Desertihabitans brevis]